MKSSQFNFQSVFQSKLLHERWVKDKEDKKIDFYKVFILRCELFFGFSIFAIYIFDFYVVGGVKLEHPGGTCETQECEE
jgi:hypothetical protein